MRILAIGLGVLLALLLTGGDRRPEPVERPISLHVRPLLLLSRGDVRVEIRVPRDVDNRAVVLAWASDVSSGSSAFGIDGEAGPVLFVRELRDQVPANYAFVATLYGAAGEVRGRADAKIVTGDEGGWR